MKSDGNDQIINACIYLSTYMFKDAACAAFFTLQCAHHKPFSLTNIQTCFQLPSSSKHIIHLFVHHMPQCFCHISFDRAFKKKLKRIENISENKLFFF